MAGGQVFGDDGRAAASVDVVRAAHGHACGSRSSCRIFDFTNLPPGRYLVFARVKDGPAAWAWSTCPRAGT